MPLALVVVLGLCFGAGDQALGTFVREPWAWQVAQVSAPWLVAPFLLGTRESRPSRATLTGAVFSVSAVAAYIAMILSPIEGVSLARAVRALPDTVGAQWPWLLGALTVAPLYGFLGCRWRVRRSVVMALVLPATLVLEPVARWAASRSLPDPTIGRAEVGVGVAVTIVLGVARVRARAGEMRHSAR